MLAAAAPLCLALALGATLPGAPPPAAAPGAKVLRFHGNRALPDEVYVAVLSLTDDTPANEEIARHVATTLEDFLHRAGYELASVSARANGPVIDVGVNEGRLEKVVFRGRLTLHTLRFQLALEIPQDVFNRPAIERQMTDLAARIGIPKAWFELVPTADVKHHGPQLEGLPAIKGVELLHAREPYELHIYFTERDWDTGVGLDLRSGYIDGLELGVNYQGHGGLLPDDRWRVAASGGAGLRQRIADDRLYPAFSRTFAEGRWYSPRIIGDFRPFIWVWGDLVGRQRPDINLEGYNAATSAASLHMEFEASQGVRLSLGGGFEWRRLFWLEAAPGFALPPNIFENERMRTFALLGADLVFDTGAARWDRRHALTVDARQFFGVKDPWFGYVAARYQKVTPFGWHDLWIRARGKWLWGEVAFHNEEPVGEYLHGLFGAVVQRGLEATPMPPGFVNKIANLSTEFRFSITRDLVKVSMFHDLAVFGELDRETGGEQLRVANSFGPGLHILIEGMLQLDIYVAFGFKSDGTFENGRASALLLKVF